ncbi:MAG: TrmH family RNA methyltransferase [Psychroflexus maritimus]
MNLQLSHEETPSLVAKQEVIVNASLITSPANLGSVFRIAEAFGVKEIYLLENQQDLIESNRFKRVSRSTEKQITVTYLKTLEDCFLNKSKVHFTPIGIELTDSAIPIHHYNNHSSVQLFVGNERTGIPNQIIHYLSETYYIPMYGKNSSINVAQSLGIALFQIRALEI